MLCGITEITFVCKKEDIERFKLIIGDEKCLGINLNFSIQEQPVGLPDAIARGLLIVISTIIWSY